MKVVRYINGEFVEEVKVDITKEERTLLKSSDAELENDRKLLQERIENDRHQPIDDATRYHELMSNLVGDATITTCLMLDKGDSVSGLINYIVNDTRKQVRF